MKRKNLVLVVTFGIFLLGAGLAYLAFRGVRIPCLFYEITGLQCPGCGNTRATLALLRLDFRAMLSYNLTYPLQLLYLGRFYFICARNYMRTGRVSYHIRPDFVDTAFLAMLLLWCILRNLY